MRKEEVLGIKPFPAYPDFEMRSGDRYDLVIILQIMLGALKLYYDDFGAVCAGGVFDDETERAVRSYQTVTKLPVTGCVDRETWNHLAEEYNAVLYDAQ